MQKTPKKNAHNKPQQAENENGQQNHKNKKQLRKNTRQKRNGHTRKTQNDFSASVTRSASLNFFTIICDHF